MIRRGKHVAPGQRGKELRHLGRAVPLALAFVLAMGAVALAGTSIGSDDVAIVGDASAAPGLALERGGPGSVFTLTVTADEGNINANQCDGVRNRVTVPTSFTITSTGLIPGSSTTYKVFPCHNYSGNGGFSETLTFSGLTVTADTSAPLGPTSYPITFAPAPSMVTLGDQITLDTGFAAPRIYVTVSDPTPTNTAPSTPGTPGLATGFATPNQGLFGLSWTASTDDQGDPVTYELQHKDSSAGATFVTVTGAGALTSNAFTFGGANPEAEGTWTYQVRAKDGSLTSAYSTASGEIKVDKSSPTAPTASLSPVSPDYNDGTIDWWGSSVTVSYSDSTDPALADGSAGSGVASYAANEIFSTTGTYLYSGTATDHAGNTSTPTTGTIGVDVTAPVVQLTCPVGPVLLGSTTSATWIANDEESGLSTPATGTVSLATNMVGTKTAMAAAGTAADNVGNSSLRATCEYLVIFDWNGFYAPVDNLPTWNSAKAGQSIPVKFSLAGNQGLSILDSGNPYNGAPRIVQIACPSSGTPDPIEEYATATANSKLIYDEYARQYNYVWKTDKTWAGKCFRLDVKLTDGTIHSANFKFTK